MIPAGSMCNPPVANSIASRSNGFSMSMMNLVVPGSTTLPTPSSCKTARANSNQPKTLSAAIARASFGKLASAQENEKGSLAPDEEDEQ